MDGIIHPGTGLYTESKKQYAKWDKETGYITSGKGIYGVKKDEKKIKAELKADRQQAIRRAKAALESGMHPRSPAYKESLRREAQDSHLTAAEKREKREKVTKVYIEEITKEMIDEHGITGN
jgi:hypothetical protein